MHDDKSERSALPVADAWTGKRVMVTGHTGFKGAWLCLMLEELGAEIHGLALAPPTDPSLFELAGVRARLAGHHVADIRDASKVKDIAHEVQPRVIFHLAAQPLVRASYEDPLQTFATNVMGTAHVLEAARATASVKTVVNVTTDKCYLNREWPWAYREDEPLGGYDPYSASKAGAELVTAAWRTSFLAKAGIAVASARAGNVIGGGDWAKDRLVPDFYRALEAGDVLQVRSPDAIRPWQHVLEPLSGYVVLAEALDRDPDRFSRAWNFGPSDRDVRSVAWVLDRLCEQHPTAKWSRTGPPTLHEAHSLKIDSSLAAAELHWRPRWPIETALARTAEWHGALGQEKPYDVCRRQIIEYLGGGPR